MKIAEQKQEWTDILLRHLAQLLGDSPWCDEIAVQYVRKTAQLLLSFAQQVAPRDKWESFVDDDVMVRSSKLGLDFRFGLPQTDGFSFAVELAPARHLIRMPDEFWCTLLELGDLGDVRFGPHCQPLRGKAVVFQVVNAFLEAERSGGLDAPFIDFGELSVVWSEVLSPVDLCDRVEQALRKMYRLGYLLYRAEYIRQEGGKSGELEGPL